MSLFCAVVLLADEPRNTGPEFGKASPFGLLVIVLLLLGTVALVWSMNRQLKKVPKSFDGEDPADPGPDDTDPSR
jgi:F0F1-type ATP synthase assembly protein I